MITYPLLKGSRFRYVPNPGTGNKSTKVTKSEKVRLANIIITNIEVINFLKLLYRMGEAKIQVNLSNRRTSKQWGVARTNQRRVVIYRHTIWVFLHEIAHILDVKKDFTGRRIRNNKPHGREFGIQLKMLYDLWMKHFDTGKQVETDKQDYFKYTEPPTKYRVPELRGRMVGGIKLQVGDAVWFRVRGIKQYGTVTKVNRVNCKVKVDKAIWRVNPKLLNKV